MKKFTLKKRGNITFLSYPPLEEIPWLIQGTSLKIETKRRDDPALLSFLEALEIRTVPLITLKQVHSSRIITIKGDPENFKGISGDGLITDLPKVAIGVFTADCVPLILVAKKRRAIGVIHAGWRGTIGGIARKAVREMIKEYDILPEEVVALMGPAISAKCYEVGEEVMKAFRECFPEGEGIISSHKGRYFIDLSRANKYQLIREGIREDNIILTELCTFISSLKLPSYRREGKKAGRMLTLAMIRG